MTAHAADCDCPTYGCMLRRRGLQVAPSAMPNRHNRKVTQTQPSSWNRQVRGEARPGGFTMPYINPDGSPVRAKQYESQHRKIKDNVARIRAQTPATAGGS